MKKKILLLAMILLLIGCAPNVYIVAGYGQADKTSMLKHTIIQYGDVDIVKIEYDSSLHLWYVYYK